MSGVQCRFCGKVGPASHMHTEYAPQFGDCLDPGDPMWVHSEGFGCQKDHTPTTQEHVEALKATGVKLGKFIYFATPNAMFKALAPVKRSETKIEIVSVPQRRRKP